MRPLRDRLKAPTLRRAARRHSHQMTKWRRLAQGWVVAGREILQAQGRRRDFQAQEVVQVTASLDQHTKLTQVDNLAQA